MERSLSLDFLRGFAIWMMIVFHVFDYSYNGMDQLQNPDYLLNLHPIFLLLAIILIQLSMWAGLFIIISCCVNVISLQHRIDEGSSLDEMRNKQIFTGFLILLLGYFTESVISYNGFFGYSLSRGELTYYGLHHGLLIWKALHIIGLSIIISSILLHELYKDGGHLKVKRNIYILTILGITVLVMTPIVNWVIRSFVYGWWTTNDVSSQFQWPPNSFGELIIRLIVIGLNGYMQPVFPFLSAAFVGTIFGVVMSQEFPDPNFPKYAMLSGLICIITGIILILIGFDNEPPINFRTEIPWFIISLGGQICSLAFITWYVEFKGHIRSFKMFSQFWRRWGMAALSIYCLQIVDYIPKIVVYLLTGETAHYRNTLDLRWSLIMVLLTVLIFDITLRLWARIDFKYSFEWFVLHLTTGKKISSDRMKVSEVVYNVTPMVFTPNK